MKNNFRLYSSIIPVEGISESLLYDLQRGKAYAIQNVFYHLIRFLDNMSIEKVSRNYIAASEISLFHSFLDNMVSSEFGFYTNEPNQFPIIENYTYRNPSIIDSVILEVGSDVFFRYWKTSGSFK